MRHTRPNPSPEVRWGLHRHRSQLAVFTLYSLLFRPRLFDTAGAAQPHPRAWCVHAASVASRATAPRPGHGSTRWTPRLSMHPPQAAVAAASSPTQPHQGPRKRRPVATPMTSTGKQSPKKRHMENDVWAVGSGSPTSFCNNYMFAQVKQEQ